MVFACLIRCGSRAGRNKESVQLQLHLPAEMPRVGIALQFLALDRHCTRIPLYSTVNCFLWGYGVAGARSDTVLHIHIE